MSTDLCGPQSRPVQLESSLPGEIWKPVPSESGVLASSYGRILLPPRYAPMTHGGFRAYFPKPRVGQVSREKVGAKHTYKIIMIRDENKVSKQRPRKVHQLVCEAFHGPKPFAKAVVIHRDEDAHNNRQENLLWGTQKENMNAPGYIRSIKARRGDARPNIKYSDAEIEEMRNMHSLGGSQSEIAKIYGVSSGFISEVINMKRRLPAPTKKQLGEARV